MIIKYLITMKVEWDHVQSIACQQHKDIVHSKSNNQNQGLALVYNSIPTSMVHQEQSPTHLHVQYNVTLWFVNLVDY